VESLRVGIFGGSFDPPHLGHAQILCDAVHAINLDKVIVVPAKVSPFKIGSTKTPPEHRLRMSQLAFPNASVSDIEIARPEPSFSYYTLLDFQKIINGEFWWIGGTDLLSGLTKWHKIEEMAGACRFAIGNRPGFCKRQEDDLPDWLVNKIDFFDSDHGISLSSTVIRENKDIWESGLDPLVREYIASQNLYLQ
jgi:nicotinate-nucleotide adenylyltransferase